MRSCKKDYYYKLLDNNRNNIEGMWNISNNIIRKRQTKPDYPEFYMDNDTTITTMNKVLCKVWLIMQNINQQILYVRIISKWQ